MWAQRRRRGQRARAVLLRAGHPRHRGAAGEVAAGDARRRAARRLLPVRAARRLRPGGDDDAGACATATSTSINGAKAWTTHGGHADFYKVMARTADDRNGISCFLVPADTDGLARTRRSGRWASPARPRPRCGSTRCACRRTGCSAQEGDGLKIALAGLDSGRLGIAAVATGLAQGALDHAVAYAKERETFGRRSSTTRGWPSCSPTWRRPCSRRGRRPRTPPGSRTGGCRSPARPRSPSCRHRQRDEGDHRRGAGARRLRLHPRLPRRALHARGEGHADLRGHQPDPADGDRPLPGQGAAPERLHTDPPRRAHRDPTPLRPTSRPQGPARPERQDAPWSRAPTRASASTPPRRSADARRRGGAGLSQPDAARGRGREADRPHPGGGARPRPRRSPSTPSSTGSRARSTSWSTTPG